VATTSRAGRTGKSTTTPESGPLLLLDGMSLGFRAYFALPASLVTSSGTVTNAVHGFTSMVAYLIREHRPSGIAVAFDLPGATFRDEIVEEYKEGRWPSRSSARRASKPTTCSRRLPPRHATSSCRSSS